MTTLALVAIAILFFLGAPIFAVMLAFAMLGALTSARGFGPEFAGQITDFLSLGYGDKSELLSTIPLFIFAGYIMAEAKTADRLVRFAQATLGWLPGGLAIGTVFACAGFTTFTGASGVTIVALGGLILPALIQQNYPKSFGLGLVTATGSIGLLFPPAVPLFVYGTIYGLQRQFVGGPEFETTRFILAGIVPGLILCGAVCVVAIITAKKNKIPRQQFAWKEVITSGRAAIWEVLIPVFVIFWLVVLGLRIPEVAALTCLYVVFIECVWYRDVDRKGLVSAVTSSTKLVGAILMIVLSASALTNYFVSEEVPQTMVTWVTGHLSTVFHWLVFGLLCTGGILVSVWKKTPIFLLLCITAAFVFHFMGVFDWLATHVSERTQFLLALNILLIFVGMMMDIFSAIVIVVPLIAMVAVKGYGIDPYHLGVIFLVNLEIGYLTPPVGLNLFISALTFRAPVTKVIQATTPFLFAMIIALGFISYVPALTIVPAGERRMTASSLALFVADANRYRSFPPQIRLSENDSVAFTDCLTIDKETTTFLGCETLFGDYQQCKTEECKKETIYDWLDSLHCADAPAILLCPQRKTLLHSIANPQQLPQGVGNNTDTDDSDGNSDSEDCSAIQDPQDKATCEQMRELLEDIE